MTTATASPSKARRATEVEPLVADPVSSKSGRELGQTMEFAKKVMVDLDSVYISKTQNIRDTKSYTHEEIEEMANQIEAIGGLLQAITIAEIPKSEKTENKPYILVTGYRRCLGLLHLAEVDPKWKKGVPANQVDEDTKGGTRLLQLLENLARKDLNAMEIALAVEEIMQDKGSDFTQKDVARLLGRSETNISQLRKLNSLPPAVQEMISNGNLPWTHARILVGSKDVPESAYLDLATKGCSLLLDQFQDLIDERFGSDAVTDGTTTAEGGAKAGAQKPAKMLRATEVSGTFVEFLENRVKEADATRKEFTAKDIETARLDTIQTVLLSQDTSLAKDIAPFQEKKKQAEVAEEQAKEAKTAENKFFRERVKRVEELLKAPPDPKNPKAERPSLAACYGSVAKEVAAMNDEQRKQAGFDFAPYKEAAVLVNKIAATYNETLINRQKAKEEKEKREAEKKKADDAAAAAAGTAAPAAPAATA